jgi:hypothetical protein
MVAIKEDRIKSINKSYFATCMCGKELKFAQKSAALNMLKRGSCRHCKRDYRSINDHKIDIYKIENKWAKKCSGCGCDQIYTRKDHAKQSFVGDWQCKKCVSLAKGFTRNMHVGSKQRLYNRFQKLARVRGIEWRLSIDEMYESYNGKCALTGWDVSIDYYRQTASLDRIDNSKGYLPDNTQWVHTMVNMCKNKYDQEVFIAMCKAVANKEKW